MLCQYDENHTLDIRPSKPGEVRDQDDADNLCKVQAELVPAVAVEVPRPCNAIALRQVRSRCS